MQWSQQYTHQICSKEEVAYFVKNRVVTISDTWIRPSDSFL